MATYIIHELQNLNSVREGEEYTGTLRGAKACATRNQSFVGTVLKITQNGETVATKDVNTGEWYSPLEA